MPSSADRAPAACVIAQPERAVERLVVSVALASVAALAWVFLAMMAAGTGMPADAAPAWQPWTAAETALVLTMWIVMMAAMMLPSAIPMVVVFDRTTRTRQDRSYRLLRTGGFVLGYLAAWSAFGFAATAAQWVLHAAALLAPGMHRASPALSGALLVAAGLYQFSALKHACLSKCRTPLAFVLSEWRDGGRGALVMGLRHGVYCVGCCWLLMALLFVAGVMNMVWIVALAVAAAAEKVLPFDPWPRRLLGAASVLVGVWLLAA